MGWQIRIEHASSEEDLFTTRGAVLAVVEK
jgi:hypothetical protein